jgi:anti-sigma factor RsiW
MPILSVPAMTCRELVQLITDYLEGNLSKRDGRRFERHLRGCDGCTTYVEQMRTTVRLAGVLGDELLAVFRDWKNR